MDGQLQLSRHDELKTDNSNSGLIAEAWHSFTNQSSTAIVAEVAAGAALITLAARYALSPATGKTALRVLSGESINAVKNDGLGLLSREGLTAAADKTVLKEAAGPSGIVFSRIGDELGSKIPVARTLEEGILPADANGLRAALERFGGITVTERPIAAASSNAAVRDSETTIEQAASRRIGFEPRAKIAPLDESSPLTDFSKIEAAMKHLPRTGFPRLD